MHVEQGLLPRRLVVTVGTSTLTRDTGSLNLHNMDHLARVLSDLKEMCIRDRARSGRKLRKMIESPSRTRPALSQTTGSTNSSVIPAS